MTLEVLKTVHSQFVEQIAALKVANVESETIRHTNMIELLAVERCLAQLIKMENINLARPPGATGPKLQ